MVGKSPVAISSLRLPAQAIVRDKLMLIATAATGKTTNAEMPATTWTRPIALSSLIGVVTGSATHRPTTAVANAQ